MRSGRPRRNGPRPVVVYAVTSPLTADLLLRGQLARVAAAGFDVRLASAPGEGLERAARREGIEAVALPMRREIAPVADLLALARFYLLLRRLRPAVVNASTPKAGLLALLAARLSRVPVRIYTLRGLRLETTNGFKRRLLAAGERWAARSAHRVIAVSPSLARRFVELELCPADKISVLAAGSSNGVQPPAAGAARASRRLRAELTIPEGAPVVGFVGRLTRDKGVGDLVAAFERLAARFPELWLVIVGDFESGDPVGERVARALTVHPRVVRTGFVAETAPYYEMMDVLAFPSHREGFPNAPLEAAMASVPTVGFAVTGTVDAIVDGATGVLVEAGDAPALAAAIARYLERPELAADHGAAARRRAQRDYRPERVWTSIVGLYRELMTERGLAPPATAAPPGRPA